MAERTGKLSDTLRDFFIKESDDLNSKIELLIEGIEDVQGIIKLVLTKYQNGEFRFHAIWRNGIDRDHKLVTDVWKALFTLESYQVNKDPLIIQYSEEEFEKAARGSHQANVKSALIWERSNES